MRISVPISGSLLEMLKSTTNTQNLSIATTVLQHENDSMSAAVPKDFDKDTLNFNTENKQDLCDNNGVDNFSETDRCDEYNIKEHRQNLFEDSDEKDCENLVEIANLQPTTSKTFQLDSSTQQEQTLYSEKQPVIDKSMETSTSNDMDVDGKQFYCLGLLSVLYCVNLC